MQAALGCCIVSDKRKDEWFVQLRVPAEAAMFAPGLILTSCFGVGREETIEKARLLAGVDEIVPHVMPLSEYRWYEPSGDLLSALARCERAFERLSAEVNKQHDGIRHGTLRTQD